MIASGVAPGDRVRVWAPNSHQFVVAALGAVSAGAVLVPINTRYKGDEAAWVLGKSKARLLLVDEGFLGNGYLSMLRAAAGARAQTWPSVRKRPGGQYRDFRRCSRSSRSAATPIPAPAASRISSPLATACPPARSGRG